MITMRLVTILIAFMVAPFVHAAPPAQPSSPVGRWQTIDDETGKAKAIVEAWEEKGELKAKIVELLNPKDPNPVCEKCEGARKGKPVRGMTIAWGLRREKNSNEWSGGRVLDPNKGKEYRCSVELIEGGKKLKVRGYMGVSLLGRTQIWQRAR